MPAVAQHQAAQVSLVTGHAGASKDVAVGTAWAVKD